jgi:hypothetical protein
VPPAAQSEPTFGPFAWPSWWAQRPSPAQQRRKNRWGGGSGSPPAPPPGAAAAARHLGWAVPSLEPQKNLRLRRKIEGSCGLRRTALRVPQKKLFPNFLPFAPPLFSRLLLRSSYWAHHHQPANGTYDPSPVIVGGGRGCCLGGGATAGSSRCRRCGSRHGTRGGTGRCGCCCCCCLSLYTCHTRPVSPPKSRQ